MCVHVSCCQWVCPLNSKNDTEGRGANSRDIILVKTADWGRGRRVGGGGERDRERVGERERERE